MTPKFKVGDVVAHRSGIVRTITAVGRERYLYVGMAREHVDRIEFVDQNYILKPKEITITKEILADVWDGHVDGFPSRESDRFKALCKGLGLE